MHYLYRITNQLNQCVYIGQTNNSNRRWSAHKNYAKNPEKTGQYIHRAMNKYGVENFTYEVIASCNSQDNADATEILLVQQYDSRNKEKGYNIKPGGESWDEEMRRHLASKIKTHYENHPEERDRVAKQAQKMWQNPEFRSMMVDVHTGRPNDMKGKNISEEMRAKILEGVKDQIRGPMSEEHKQTISNTKKSFSKEKKQEIKKKMLVSKDFVVLSLEQELSIINDSRPSRTVAKEYNVHPATIQRIRKKYNCSFPVGRRK